jgi:acyl-CoA thioesterase
MQGHDEAYEKIKGLLHSIPFWRHLGLRVDFLGEGFARLVLPAGDYLCNTKGTVHGGVISSLIDSGAGTAIRTVVPSGQAFSTIELKVNYLAPAPMGDIIAEGRVVRCGKKIAVGSVDVKDSVGNLVATGLASFLMF